MMMVLTNEGALEKKTKNFELLLIFDALKSRKSVPFRPGRRWSPARGGALFKKTKKLFSRKR
jgi:hypothetical protein